MDGALILILAVLVLAFLATYCPWLVYGILGILGVITVLSFIYMLLERLFPKTFNTGPYYTPNKKPVDFNNNDDDRIPPNDFPHSGGGY